MLWFIKREALQELDALKRAGFMPTPSMIESFDQRMQPVAGDPPRILRVVGSEAEIVVEGALSKRASAMLYYWNGSRTTYQDIQDALLAIDSEPSIKRVTMRIDSPGGTVDGFFDLLSAIQHFVKTSGKPLTARVSNAYSAAYGIAAMCSKIEAVGASSGFGSVGVATTYAFWEGETLIDLTNKGSEAKRPDPRTEEGRAVIVKELDDYAALFVQAISIGRTAAGSPIEAGEVLEAYGSGACVLASEAKRRGMADSIAKPNLRAVRSDNDGPEPEAENPATVPSTAAARGTETRPMDLKKLKADHPEVYEAAVKDGVTAERDRVTAHLMMGESSGDLNIALKAIKDGSAMTTTLQAEYMGAAMKRADKSARQTESDDVAKKTADVTPATASAPGAVGDLGDQVVAKLKQQRTAGLHS